jgi:hypothetical protein
MTSRGVLYECKSGNVVQQQEDETNTKRQYSANRGGHGTQTLWFKNLLEF